MGLTDNDSVARNEHKKPPAAKARRQTGSRLHSKHSQAMIEYADRLTKKGPGAGKTKARRPERRTSGRAKIQKHNRALLLGSDLALGIYAVLALFLWIRELWVLNGVGVLLLAQAGDILLDWFWHMAGGHEIQQCKGWLVWWWKIGLDFATRTIEGHTLHRVLVANTLNFWNLVGKNYTLHWFGDIHKKGRASVLDRARERLEQSSENHRNFAAGLRENLEKRRNGFRKRVSG
ncbi:unnamed protein product [Pseudo-nitzschia multistriata]|uniref:Uncharacterized protein n=1 Tax=Pseudo-nitzschia multistriata TaxID=183589 RepID=A0A448YU94_9STRA|nr:unnamed protein product [Pseudo-nitzschia multistriata]